MEAILARNPSPATARRWIASCLLAGAVFCGYANAQTYNAAPSLDNPVNTHINRTIRSTDFNCQALVKSIWMNDGGIGSVAFSDDEIWYRVESPEIRTLLYMAHAIGKKVCYQTEGGAMDPIKVSSAFIDPR